MFRWSDQTFSYGKSCAQTSWHSSFQNKFYVGSQHHQISPISSAFPLISTICFTWSDWWHDFGALIGEIWLVTNITLLHHSFSTQTFPQLSEHRCLPPFFTLEDDGFCFYIPSRNSVTPALLSDSSVRRSWCVREIICKVFNNGEYVHPLDGFSQMLFCKPFMKQFAHCFDITCIALRNEKFLQPFPDLLFAYFDWFRENFFTAESNKFVPIKNKVESSVRCPPTSPSKQQIEMIFVFEESISLSIWKADGYTFLLVMSMMVFFSPPLASMRMEENVREHCVMKGVSFHTGIVGETDGMIPKRPA